MCVLPTLCAAAKNASKSASGVLPLQTYRHGVGFPHGIIDGGGMVPDPEAMDDGFFDDPEVCPMLCPQLGSCAPAAQQ